MSSPKICLHRFWDGAGYSCCVIKYLLWGVQSETAVTPDRVVAMDRQRHGLVGFRV